MYHPKTAGQRIGWSTEQPVQDSNWCTATIYCRVRQVTDQDRILQQRRYGGDWGDCPVLSGTILQKVKL